jgi:hypothetical protein
MAALVLCLSGAARGAPAADPAARSLAVVAAQDLCVTHGALKSGPDATRITEPAVRAFGRGTDGDAVGLRFRYLGPAGSVSKLASGDVRSQLGLKLRAQDGCNLLYVMWRFAPTAEVVVQVKRNPGARTHEECGTRGYVRLAAAQARPVAAPEPGSTHTIQAEIVGAEVVVWIDGQVVWQGALPDAARELAGGPAGLRSDNVAAEVELLALPAPAAGGARCAGHVTGDD